jgi:Ca-activated chloride channel homolog
MFTPGRSRKTFSLLLVSLLSVSVPVAQDPVQPPPPRPATEQKSDKSGKLDRRQNAVRDDQSQDRSSDTIKIETQLVQLDVTVIDQNNNPVFGLSKEDFTVYEDKVKQTINSLSREEVPLSFGIVIDTSGTMRPILQTVSDAGRDLIKQMRPDDEAFLAQFKIESELVQDFTHDKRELEESMEQLYTMGGTALLDAIIATSDYANEKGEHRRKAIVVISDGIEKNSASKIKEVIDAIKENEVQLYMIGFIEEDETRSFFGKSARKKAQELLFNLAEDSGGRAFFPKDVAEIPAIAQQIAKDMRTQYVISYYPSNFERDGSFRVVRVDVTAKNNRKLIARTRRGYYARGEQESKREKGTLR